MASGVWVIDTKRYKGKLQVAKPLFGTPTISGLRIFGRRGLAKQLNADGGLTADDTTMVAAALGERFALA